MSSISRRHLYKNLGIDPGNNFLELDLISSYIEIFPFTLFIDVTIPLKAIKAMTKNGCESAVSNKSPRSY